MNAYQTEIEMSQRLWEVLKQKVGHRAYIGPQEEIRHKEKLRRQKEFGHREKLGSHKGYMSHKLPSVSHCPG